MAQLVCIAAGTCRPGINEIGDVVDVHDDDVLLNGTGYMHFEVLQVYNLTGSEVRAKYEARSPKGRYNEKEDRWEWLNPVDGKWYVLKRQPKYKFSTSTLSVADKVILSSGLSSDSQINAMLDKCTEKISADPDNLTIPIVVTP